MKLNYKTGDFLQNETGILVHGCNTQSIMGAGAAKMVREKYPENYTYYSKCCSEVAFRTPLGCVIWYNVTDNLKIANALTQVSPGKNAKSLYVLEAMTDVFDAAECFGMHVHSVKIGCGIGGLHWDGGVEDIFLNLMKAYPHVECTIWEI